MVEQALQGKTTIDIFEKRAIELQKVNPEESKKLAGELLYWASSVDPNGTFGETLASQINYQVREQCKSGNPTTTEKFVEMLFSPNPEGKIDADIIMGRLQIG